MKHCVFALAVCIGQAATLTLSAPAFMGCQDHFACEYSGFTGSFDSKVGSIEIGTITFANHPSPAPDQHDMFLFSFNVNGYSNVAALFYTASTTEALFDFIFGGSPTPDPRIRFDMFRLTGPVDGLTPIPVILRVADITDQHPIHMPEPGTAALAVAGILATVALRSRLLQSRRELCGIANGKQSSESL